MSYLQMKVSYIPGDLIDIFNWVFFWCFIYFING